MFQNVPNVQHKFPQKHSISEVVSERFAAPRQSPLPWTAEARRHGSGLRLLRRSGDFRRPTAADGASKGARIGGMT